MIKNDYIFRAKRFIKEFYPFIKYIPGDNIYSYKKAAKQFNNIYNRSVKHYSGATRNVFVTSDYCVKFDMKRQSDWGNCETEYAAYQAIKNTSVETFFAPITKFTYQGMDFYIMPRCNQKRIDYGDIFSVLDDCGATPEQKRYITHHIDDLHNGNFYYNERTKKLIIFDYAANDF